MTKETAKSYEDVGHGYPIDFEFLLLYLVYSNRKGKVHLLILVVFARKSDTSQN